MKKLAKAQICWLIGYCLVAGLAWKFVLNMNFPFWKLLIIAVLQVIVNTVQFFVVSETDNDTAAKNK